MKLFLITGILDNAIIKTTGSLVNCKVMTISNHLSSLIFPFFKIVPYVFVPFCRFCFNKDGVMAF